MSLLNLLTDRKVKSFAAAQKIGAKLFDGGGLFLTITPAGSAIWRIKYRLGGKEKTYTVGAYPDVGLEAARIERGTVRAGLLKGHDPVMARRIERAANVDASGSTFATLVTEWLRKQKPDWSSTHYRKTKQAIERDLIPSLGPWPVASITPSMVAAPIEAIVRRGARETASKALWSCKGVFELAQARGLCRDNPALPARAVLPRGTADVPMPAFTTWSQLGDVLRKAQQANLTRVVHMAHRLLAFTGARIGNVVEAEWREFDLDAEIPRWTIARSKMKQRHDRTHDHTFILCSPIVNELRAWRSLIGAQGHLFPSAMDKPHISRESIEKAYRVTLGLKGRHTPHGWRAALNTLAMDEGGFARDVVQIALDHVHETEVVRAYDRGERLQQRIALAEWWGKNLIEAEATSGQQTT